MGCTRKNCPYPHLKFHELAVSQMQKQSEENNDTAELCTSYFMHGNCQRKSKCYKLHTANSWFCMDYLRGDCNRSENNCPNPHLKFHELAEKEAERNSKKNDETSSSTTSSSFDLSERLRNRSTPDDVEMMASMTSTTAVCRFYRDGYCKKGRSCDFRHVKRERN
jgi:hypothetical protein